MTQRCGFGNGKVLARLAAQYDCKQIGKGRLTSDAVVATSTGRLRLTVITANMRDFSKLAEFRPFHWRVENPHASQLVLKKQVRAATSRRLTHSLATWVGLCNRRSSNRTTAPGSTRVLTTLLGKSRDGRKESSQIRCTKMVTAAAVTEPIRHSATVSVLYLRAGGPTGH